MNVTKNGRYEHENYNALMTKLNIFTYIQWKGAPCSWVLEELILLKYLHCQKYRFTSPHKNTNDALC